MVRLKDSALSRGLLAIEKHKAFIPEHYALLHDLCNWYCEYGYYTRPQRENVRKHLLEFYVPALTAIANKEPVKAPINTVKTDEPKPKKEKREMKKDKDATKKVEEKKSLTYEERWAKLATDLEAAGRYRDWETDRKSTRLNSSHSAKSRMPSSA